MNATLPEIEAVVSQLPNDELGLFSDWFEELLRQRSPNHRFVVQLRPSTVPQPDADAAVIDPRFKALIAAAASQDWELPIEDYVAGQDLNQFFKDRQKGSLT